MRKVLSLTLAIAAVVFFALPMKTLAANDTLVVYANGPSLDQVVNSDTTSAGLQAHSVYKLVSLDTTYIFLGPANVKANMTFVGVLGSNGRPPCIQPGVLSDASVPAELFSMASKGTTCNFTNLYIFELSTGDTSTGGTTFNVSADSVRVYLNNVIDEENHYVIIWYSGQGDNFFIKNCKVRNGVSPTDWYAPGILSPNGYLPVYPIDTLVMDYNTFFCTNGGAGGSTFCKHLEFLHNSIVYSFYTAMVPPPGYIANGKIDNNIFYGVMAGGNSKSEFTWMDDPFQPQVSSVIDCDTMTASMDSTLDPADAGKANWRMLAEAKRSLEIKDNVYYMPKPITDYLTAWDDTASSADSLYTPGWMNTRTTYMFTDKTDWPGFVASGNIITTDPGYGSSFVNSMNGGTGYGVGLLNYIGLVRDGSVTTQEWGYHKQSVTGGSWIPNWPLPEATDMKYSSASVKANSTDGYPAGDPYWFNGLTAVKQQVVSVATVFSLAQNYPNPFNPSTQIDFSIPQQSNVQLKVYNTLGQLVATLVNGNLSAGSHSVTFNAQNLASGLYIYRLSAGNFTSVKKMMMLK